VPDGVQDTGTVAATLSFDLDLWGRNRAALAAATSDALAGRADAAQARLLLTSAIAAAYADLSGYMDQRDSAAQTLRVRQSTAALTGDRTTAGLDNRGSQRQAEARVGAAQADVTALDEAIALTRHRIAALLGKGPDRGLAITRPHLTAPPAGIPADAGIALVGRRPDIVAARLRAESAGHRIDVAHADFYPNIRLSALVGMQALGLGHLFDSGSEYGNGGAAISLPIFQGGAISGRYRGARAQYDAAVAAYDQTLTGALREVADTLSSRASIESQIADQRAALTAATEAANIARLRYRAGLSNQLPLLTAEDSMIALTRSVAVLEARRLSLDIMLIRALGGGYRNASPAGDQ
jgi:NodT family efflux transporter outer membrane factor (OMF) lipoprotein